MRAERAFPVPPLAVPDLQCLPDPATLEQYGAMALFVDRARAVKPRFQLTTANARALAEICVRLEGLPLALELAAARIKLLPPHSSTSQSIDSSVDPKCMGCTSATTDTAHHYSVELQHVT